MERITHHWHKHSPGFIEPKESRGSAWNRLHSRVCRGKAGTMGTSAAAGNAVSARLQSCLSLGLKRFLVCSVPFLPSRCLCAAAAASSSSSQWPHYHTFRLVLLSLSSCSVLLMHQILQIFSTVTWNKSSN